MNKPRIIVCGGDGFIGSHIIRLYYKSFDFVVLKRKGSTVHFPEIERFAMVVFEPEASELVRTEFQAANGMILLGASRRSAVNLGEEKDMLVTELSYFHKMLDLCVANKIEKVVFASSKSVYGKQNHFPFKENERPVPDTFYGLNKLFSEELGMLYAKYYRLKFAGLRLAQVFGAGDWYPNLFNTFMKNAGLNNNLEIWGDPKQDIRTYLYVKDAADVLIHFLNKQEIGIFNVGMDRSFNPFEIAQFIIKNTSTKSKIIFKPENPNQIRNAILSNESIIQIAGWQPRWNMPEAISDFWNEISQPVEK